jgi:hypothetical protein
MGGLEIRATGKSVVGRRFYFVRVTAGKVVEFRSHLVAARDDGAARADAQS